MARLTATHRQVAHWLATGETGLSSETMALWLAFGERTKHRSHPLDPADFDRCLRLLQAAPRLRDRLKEMANVSPFWALLVIRWDDIERSHLDEVGLGWSKSDRAPKTYQLIKEVLEPGYDLTRKVREFTDSVKCRNGS